MWPLLALVTRECQTGFAVDASNRPRGTRFRRQSSPIVALQALARGVLTWLGDSDQCDGAPRARARASMEKVWLASYPPGVPAEADVAACRSIGEAFEKSVAAFGPRAAFVSMETAISYAETERLSRNFAAYLQTVLKLSRGARVALMMPNVLQYPIALFGALRAGYTVVNCNPLYTPRELKHQLIDSGAVAIVVVENFASVVEQAIADSAIKH